MSKRAKVNDVAKVVLNAGSNIIKQSETEKLLGAMIDKIGGWRVMLRDGEQSVMKQIITRISGLKKIAKNADFETKLSVANGIVQSKLQYLMPLWMGAPDYLVNTMQVQQLNAARVVCGYQSFYWSREKLLNKCGWLSIKQQMVVSTVTLAHNIITTGVPRNIYANLISEFPYQTRQKTNKDIRLDGNRSHQSEKTFKNRARVHYNQIPAEIRQMEMKGFKTQVKKWVKTKVPII